MKINKSSTILSIIIVSLFLFNSAFSKNKQDDNRNSEGILFPVTPNIFIEGVFSRCEGIAFNGENQLFVAGDKAIWKISPSGECLKIFSASSNLGLAPIGDRDILFADFGPTNAFDNGYNRDGMVWRVTPEGLAEIVADSIGDPNCVTVFEDGFFIVSDDATDEIHLVDKNGKVSIFSQKIKHPNGMILSLDGSILYVAQIFKQINPFILDGKIWAIQLIDNMPAGEPELVIDMGDDAGNDGLAMDILGRIYVSCWYRGEIWRFDIGNNELVLIAKDVPGVASLAFGRGEFDNKSIYATSTRTGKVWKIPVGIEGAILNK